MMLGQQVQQQVMMAAQQGVNAQAIMLELQQAAAGGVPQQQQQSSMPVLSRNQVLKGEFRVGARLGEGACAEVYCCERVQGAKLSRAQKLQQSDADLVVKAAPIPAQSPRTISPPSTLQASVRALTADPPSFPAHPTAVLHR